MSNSSNNLNPSDMSQKPDTLAANTSTTGNSGIDSTDEPFCYVSAIIATTLEHLEAMAAKRDSITQESMDLYTEFLSIDDLNANQKDAVARAMLPVLAGNTSLENIEQMREICQKHLLPLSKCSLPGNGDSQVQKILSKEEQREVDVAKAVSLICQLPARLMAIRKDYQMTMEPQETASRDVKNAKMPEQVYPKGDNKEGGPKH